MTETDWSARIGRAKAAIDNGFSRIGPSLRSDAGQDRAFLSGAGGVIRLANAVALLCKHRHARECGALLRRAMGTAVAMREMARDGLEGPAAPPARADGRGGAGLEAEPDWRRRAERAGLAREEIARWERDLRAVDDGASAGAAGIPWAHVFADASAEEPSTEEVLRLMVRIMAFSIDALNRRWPGAFPGSEELSCGA